jgi:hypothetical protein
MRSLRGGLDHRHDAGLERLGFDAIPRAAMSENIFELLEVERYQRFQSFGLRARGDDLPHDVQR